MYARDNVAPADDVRQPGQPQPGQPRQPDRSRQLRQARQPSKARQPGQATPELPTEEQVEAATAALRMLADGTRLRLMWLLREAEYDVGTLTAAVGAARPAVSQHLAKLRLAGLVTVRRDGRRALYTARRGHVRRLVAEALYAADHQVSGAPDHD